MADTKITALAAIATVDPAADVLPIVDISDTSMAASGTTKKVTSNQILGAGGTATLASATITGAATVGTTLGVTGVSTFAAGTALLPALTTTGDTNTGIYYPAADTFAVTTGGTERYRVDSTGLGIGATPAERLTIGSTTAANYIKLTNSGAATGLLIGSFNTAVDIKNREVGAINLFTSDTQRMVISATGDVTISTGNVVMGTSGKGIDFSATASGSGTMTSELLNDYEEGTWVGTLTGSTTNPTVPVTATGRYTKIGRVVTVQIFYSNVSTVGASGNIGITGLPFANSTVQSVGAVSLYQIGTFTGSTFSIIDSSNSSIEFNSNISGSVYGNVTHNAGIARYMTTSITYTVA